MDRVERTFRFHLAWLGLFSLILFGFAGISGRPLTMHEARLPQTAREMLWHHEWLLPTSGNRPWLERPPLPHWLVIGSMKLFGSDDRVWVVRLPSAIIGMLTVLLTAVIAKKLFGPGMGIVSGLVLATSLKFYQYATLAEDDIYLAMFVALAAALFTHSELGSHRRVKWFGFVTNRSGSIWLFFIVLGLSNLTKGPLLGILILGTPVGAYLCIRSVMERRIQPLFRYTWLWGWLMLIALTAAWPWWAYRHVPDVVENWRYDYLGRMSGVYTAINEPWWYYPPKLLVGLLPWTPFCLIAIVVVIVTGLLWPMWKRYVAQTDDDPFMLPGGQVLDYSSVRNQPWWHCWVKKALVNYAQVDPDSDRPIPWPGFIWILCWAVVPLVVLSIPKGKHEHYLVPFLAPWAILATLGLIGIGQKLNLGKKSLIGILIAISLGYSAGESLFAARTDHTADDTAFLLRVRSEVPADAPLYINAKLGPPGNLDFFRMQFYSRPDAILLHNLSFLRDKNITAPSVYVISRQVDQKWLRELGSIEVIDQSAKSHEIETPDGRFTLFRLKFDASVQRYPLPPTITSLQAMERAPGPWCGPAMQ